MRMRALTVVCVSAGLAAGCGSSPSTPAAAAPTAPTAPAAPAITLSAPVPVAPASNATTSGWPTFTVNDSIKTGNASPLVYRFDVSISSTFAAILLTSTVSETPGQTSFTPPSGTAAPPQTSLFWRVVAIDPFNIVASPATAATPFTWAPPPSAAQMMASLEGITLWPGAQPPGTTGHAKLGSFWDVAQLTSFNGATFLSPTIDEIQVFDLLDRGMDPQSAIDWMHANGYQTNAAWYSVVSVIGFSYEYMALISGHWDLVLKAGA